MAIRQRILRKLKTLEDQIKYAMESETYAILHDINRNLIWSRDETRKGLSDEVYSSYGEVYDGLTMAFRQMLAGDSTSPKKEVLPLCRDLVDHLAIKTGREKNFKKEIFFLPYKVTMWDSLESVWMAADADKEHAIAYVMPIPYADRNPDGTAREWHCERESFPEYVPTLKWEDVDLKAWHPDVIYIHNPYDAANAVTSVDSNYYSHNLRPCTDCLVYVPYYATAGGASGGQTFCPAYANVDYIVIQAKKYRKFFDERVSDGKFLPLGSPKFDKVIRLCKNPPPAPEAWSSKLKGKKVFFYNTSLAGLLNCVPQWMEKLRYVFSIFRDRNDVCLLWRPHPLLEATIKSMRQEYLSDFEKMRDGFVAENFGIYDTTPDIEKTIALCDAYIGDGGTSVTSLFGMAGKPVFYLNNMIHRLPAPNDWFGQVNRVWQFMPKNWLIVYGNQLWHSKPKNDLQFHYCCDLSPYGGGGFYDTLLEIEDRLYVCPNNAQDIIVIENDKISRKIQLERKIEQTEAFAGATYLYQEDEDYFFLMPVKYPAVVRYDFRHDKVDYVACPNDIFVTNVINENWRGAVFHWRDWLIFGSAVDSQGYAVNRNTLETKKITICHENFKGSMFTLCWEWGEDEIFFVPYMGNKITKWNLSSDNVQEYDFPNGFYCQHPVRGNISYVRPFTNGIFKDKNTILLAPLWGNMFVKLHIDTGVMEEWKTPFEVAPKSKNEYYYVSCTGFFISELDRNTKAWKPKRYQFYYIPTRTRYDFDPITEEFTLVEKDVVIDESEIRRHVPGFCQMSEYDAYGCWEDAFNSLKDFVDGNISGKQFDQEAQRIAYSQIVADTDGTAGEKIYQYIRDYGKVRQ